MKLMLVGQKGRMNTVVKQQAEKRGWSVVCWMPGQRLEDKIDVVIDFSSPEAWESLDILFKDTPLPLISGTTGLGHEHHTLAQKWSQRHPVYYAPNFSSGIQAMRTLSRTHKWEGWDISLSECHHATKKDAPSGTALMLADDFGIPAESIIVTRDDHNPGRHRLHFRCDGEELVIEHQAEGREIFADGALDLVSWLIAQPAGRYGEPIVRLSYNDRQ